jgi:hypothetical protein
MRGGTRTATSAGLFAAGFGLVNVADGELAHAIGAACLMVLIATGFAALVPLRVDSVVSQSSARAGWASASRSPEGGEEDTRA